MVSASEHAYKDILTSLPKPGGGEFGKFYRLPALNDPRIGNSQFMEATVLSCIFPLKLIMWQVYLKSKM